MSTRTTLDNFLFILSVKSVENQGILLSNVGIGLICLTNCLIKAYVVANNSDWVIESGATSHLTHDIGLLNIS